MVDWERLERELDGVGSVRRVGRWRPAVVLALVLVLAASGVVAAVLLSGHGRHGRHGRTGAATPGSMATPRKRLSATGTFVAPGTEAAIYAAVLSGGPAPQPLRRPVWVRSSVCDAVPTTPSRRACTDAPIPGAVRRQVVAILGRNVQFADAPPLPARSGDPPVVQFGRLLLTGDTAQIGVETWCGVGCAEGETLALRFRDAAWQVAGTVGPRWVS